MKKSILYILFAFCAILFFGARAEAGILEGFACVDTYGSDLASCMEARSVCHFHCAGVASCDAACESAYSQCISRATFGGALGIPQGFISCIDDALYEEPMLQTDIDNLWRQCINRCGSERRYCLDLGDEMDPTPEDWDEGCYEMSMNCTVACMEIGPLSF